MKKAYKALYLEAMKETESYREALDMTVTKLEEKNRIVEERLDRLNTIASNNLKLRGELARHRIISFMLAMGLLVQYCLFKFY